MKSFKKIFFTLILMIFCVCPIFTGCEYTTKLSSPEVTIFSGDNCIAFKSVSGTTTYDIYCNDELFESYENEDKAKSILYDYSEALVESGKYEFYVVAVSNSLYLKDSDPSNVVETTYTKITTPVTPPVEEDEISMDFNISDNGGQVVVSYTPIENNDTISGYTLYLYSNTSGLKSYPVTNNIINISNSEFDLKHEIYAIRMGYTDESGSHISSNIKYYNPDNCKPYTDNIYIFDGYIHDHYITTLNELNNIMYYTYIYRVESFDIKISDGLKNIISTLDGSYMVNKMNEAVNNAIRSYYETQSYYAANVNNGFVQQLSNSTEYNIKVSYYGVRECDVTIQPSTNAVYGQADNNGYYDIVDYEMLGDDYDNFVSDHYFLYTTCSTSEQLYWAVENKITPIVVNGSRADVIYSKAKDVLRDIISEDMTDYEKALSIFDWICLNTNYDYTNYDSMYRGGMSLGNIPMYLPCFYLEGVFMTGYAVCDGFSKAYSLMCNMLGIDTLRIVGEAITNGERGGHAWNKVLIDPDDNGPLASQYYLVDITWTEILSSEEEVLSHLYFLLGDEDCEGTHYNFEGRKDKYDKYSAEDNYYYYNNGQFVYEDREMSVDKEYNWVIESDTEMKDLFYYTLDNSLDSVEYVVDIDYMIDYYNYINGEGSYRSSNEVEYSYAGAQTLKYEYSSDTLSIYVGQVCVKQYKYYKLRETFIECMRSLKFKEQYFNITNFDGELVYNQDGDIGILYVLEQNLCIDEVGEEVHLFNYLANSEILGEYELYVTNSILQNLTGNTTLSKMQLLITSLLESTNMKVQISQVQSDDAEMQKFILTITEN